MELDVFKTAWKQLDQTQKDESTKKAIFEVIDRQTVITVGAMRRNLLFEVVAVILLYGTITAFFLIEFESRFWPVSVFMLLTGIFYLVYLKKKNQLLLQLFSAASNVRSNLETRLRSLSRYIRFYIIAGTIQFPTTIVFLVIVFASRAAVSASSTERVSNFLNSWEGISAIISSFLLMIVCCYYLNRWYVHKLYGKHLEHLRQVVEEFREDVD